MAQNKNSFNAQCHDDRETKDCTTIVTNMRNMRNMRNELGGEEEGGEGGTHCHHP
jgi:hypothetical protein